MQEETNVVVENSQLKIILTTDDAGLVEHFGSMQLTNADLGQVIEDYLKIYVKILDDLSPRATEISVSKSVGKLDSTVETSTGRLIETVSKAATDVDTLLKKNLGRHGETPKAIEQFQKEMLDYVNDAESPLYKLMASQFSKTVEQSLAKSHLTTQSISKAVEEKTEPKFNEVMDYVRRIESEVSAAKKVAEVVAGTPLKGQPYEDQVFQYLAPMASAAADICEDKSKEKGVLGGMSGDFVVTHMVDGKARFNVVFEAKAGAMSKAQWEREADKAIPNRDAAVFVGLAKDTDSVPGGSGFTMLRENLIVLGFDPESEPSDLAILDVVYKYAMTLARTSVSRKSSGNNEASSELRKIIEELKGHQRIATNVEKHGKTLREFIESLSSRLPEVARLMDSEVDE